ncbi:PKD domain-containing protein [Streptomyces toxytricini]|uniref:PKD domain-containing protein n=1 Tax=Streptomyces toxytricini TaxID=67369 RepID=A0ABW8EL40_STRT5
MYAEPDSILSVFKNQHGGPVRNRRLVISAAVAVAASFGTVLVPAAAQAAPARPAAKGAPAGGVDAGPLAKPEAKTFHSPAERSVRKALPGTKGKAGAGAKAGATAQSDATAQAEPAPAANEELAVVLNGRTTTAHGVELQAAIVSVPGTTLKVTFDWGDGSTETADGLPGLEVKRQHRYAELGEYNVKVTVTDAANNAQVVNEVPLSTSGSDFTPHTPTRLLDTRTGGGKVAPYTSTRVKIAGNAKIPAGATAVALNVTVTNTATGGHVTAFPGGGQRPATSNLNFEAGQTVPNMVIVPVGKDGTVELYNGGWEAVDLIADVTGYFSRTASSGYTPMTPVRTVDTRSGLGAPRAGQVAGRGSFSTQLGGLYVPSNATAVALNVTATGPREAGHLTVYPSGQAAPNTSNVNFTAGQTIANSVIVPVGSDGRISVMNGAWAGVDVIVDVVGYYSPDSSGAFMATAPHRRLDTRTWGSGPLAGQDYIWMALSHKEEGIAGYVLNTTVTNTRDSGFLSVAPDVNAPASYFDGTAVWQDPPRSSSLNFTPGKTVPNLVQASSGGTNGTIDLWNQSFGDIDLIVDMFGYYETK